MAGDTSREARPVLPQYNVRQAKACSLGQGLVGLLMMILGSIALIMRAFTSVGSTGILTGVTMVLSGMVGGLTATKFVKEIWIVSIAMVISVVSLALNMALVGAAVTGLHKEVLRTDNMPSSVQTREALSVCELILGVCGILITSFSIYLCSLALFYGCCKMSPPVTYMVNYRIDENQTNGARIDIRNTMAMDIITSQPELTSQEVTYNIRY